MSAGDTKCMAPRSIDDVKQDLPALMDSMGMNDMCQRQASNFFANSSASAEGHLPFSSAKMQASIEAGSTSMAEKGCGQFNVNLNDAVNHMQDINCSLQSSSSTTNQLQSNSASIEITTVQPSAEQEKMMNALIASQQKIVDHASDNAMKMGKDADAKTQAFLMGLVAMATKTLEDMQSVGNINITNSSIRVSTTQKMSTSISMGDSARGIVSDALKAQTKSAAEQKMRQTLGVTALTPNTKQLISTHVDNNTVLSKNNIQSTVKSINLTQVEDGKLIITNASGGSINITNTTLENNPVATMATNALMGSSSHASSQAVSDIMNDAVTKQKEEGKSAGVDDLAREMGKANANAINAGGKGGAFEIIGGIVVVIVLAVGGFLYMKSQGGGGKGKGGKGGTGVRFKIPLEIILGVLAIGIFLILGKGLVKTITFGLIKPGKTVNTISVIMIAVAIGMAGFNVYESRTGTTKSLKGGGKRRRSRSSHRRR